MELVRALTFVFRPVQCDKCKKWRKIAPHISASELPEVWTCSMNTWNPSAAACEAPEDKADGLQDTGFGNSGTSETNKFTYRHLIFGTGKRGTRPVSERTRAAESIFAVQHEEDDPPAKALYANSSAFVSKGKHNIPLVDEAECISVFEVMSHSRLWQDLRSSATSYAHGVTPESTPSMMAGYTYENLPSVIQKKMKEFVLEILGLQLVSTETLTKLGTEAAPTSLSESCRKAQPYCTLNVVGTTLFELVKDGVVECVRNTDVAGTMMYRRIVKPQPKAKAAKVHRVSRCMKIAKPWKRARVLGK